MLSNPGTPFDIDGWADALSDIRKLYLMMGGGSNDLNQASKGVDQSVSEVGFPTIANNLSEYAGNTTAITQIRNNLGVPAGLAGLFTFGGMPVGGNLLATSYGAGSGTHTFNPRSLYCFFRLTGGGGQGGNGAVTDDIFSGGGGEGATLFGCMKIEGFTKSAFTTGAGGSGGTINDGNVGGNGADSTIVVNGITITAYGGRGGKQGGTKGSISPTQAVGGLGGAVQFWVDTKFFQWGTSGNRGHGGGYGTAGAGGASYNGGDYGAGSAGGWNTSGSNPGNAGIVTFYELFT